MITLYIAICIIWGVFFTGYLFRNNYRLHKNDRADVGMILVFFVITVVGAPFSMWYNIPYIIDEFKIRN